MSTEWKVPFSSQCLSNSQANWGSDKSKARYIKGQENVHKSPFEKWKSLFFKGSESKVHCFKGSENPCFLRETDSEDLHWFFFHDRLGSLTLKIMWRIFCLACCCPGEACFSNAFTSVSAQAGTSKNHPSKRQMTEMKWSLLHLTDSEKTFLLSHASLISPSSTLSPVRTTRSGWGHSTGRTCQVSKVKLPIESSKCIQLLNVLSCLLKIPIAHQRSLFSWLSAIYALDFDEKSLRNLKASQLELPVAGTDAGVPWPKFNVEGFANLHVKCRCAIWSLMHWMLRLKLLVSPELHVFGLRVNLSDVTVCCCELSQCREAWFQLSHYKMCPSVVVGKFRNRSGRLLERLTVAAESEKRRIATVFRDESVLRDLHEKYIKKNHLRKVLLHVKRMYTVYWTKSFCLCGGFDLETLTGGPHRSWVLLQKAVWTPSHGSCSEHLPSMSFRWSWRFFFGKFSVRSTSVTFHHGDMSSAFLSFNMYWCIGPKVAYHRDIPQQRQVACEPQHRSDGAV